jgi:glucose-1-phosphatase
MNGNRIRCIFFDLGNVLVDLDYRKFNDRMMSLTGLGTEELRRVFEGSVAVLQYELGTITDDEFLAAICREARINLARRDFLDAWTCIFSEKPLLSEELLSGLARDYALWIVSNTNNMHFQLIRDRYSFLTTCFQGYILSYEIGASKPNPAIFLHALNKARITAPEVLFIDDQLPNVESARKLGMHAFQFLSPAQTMRELNARNMLSRQFERLNA